MRFAGHAYVGSIGAGLAMVAAAISVAGPGGRGVGGKGGGVAAPPPPFVNWETPQVHPMDMTPDGLRLLVCNTADARLEVFSIASGSPQILGSVPVGLDPVSVRARSNGQAWVVNQISDSVSVVDLASMNVVATLRTLDEPADVAFAGNPARGFVSCSQTNTLMVFDPANLATPPVHVPIDGEDPRALAVSEDGSQVYLAVFESGNGSTALGGGSSGPNIISFPPNVVSDPAGPYGGVNPPPNFGGQFKPPIAQGNLPAPKVGLIVKKNAQGKWMDDNNGDWTSLVSGANAAKSGRVVGWDLPDRDLAIVDANSLSVSYATGLMNLCMAVGVNPSTGLVGVVGTDAINEVRFEPNVNGIFVRVKLAQVNPGNPGAKTVMDLNPHLDYSTPTLPQGERDKSVGDPRALVWNAAGTRGYITGLGSNNVIVVDGSGNRAGLSDTIEVGEGPTGLALNEGQGLLYVLNRFAGTISVVSTASEQQIDEVPFFDPTPPPIKVGRKHLYDTIKNSGLGQASCASCHVDARMDRLAWDLGDPAGSFKPLTGQNLGAGVPGLEPNTASPKFAPWHAMKGVVTTQTLQDIIGHEPHHWRGDRAGIEEFNPAFIGLLGDDTNLSVQEMQEFEDFLASITYPPNPFRNFDNALPTSVPLPGHFTTGRFAPAGQPLPAGNAMNGMTLYRSTQRLLDQGTFACVTCHTLPTGTGPDMTFSFPQQKYVPLPPGPLGERHHSLVSVDGVTNISIKVAQLRNLYEKTGFNTTQQSNRAGFGYMHDGAVDSIERFVSLNAFNVASDQEVADLTAFMLCFSGSELPEGSPFNILIPPGTPSKDTAAAVGWQTTLIDAGTAPPDQHKLIDDMTALAQAGKVGLVVKGLVAGQQRGYAYTTGNMFQSDIQAQTVNGGALRDLAELGGELTYTVVPLGSQTRIGIDRDLDGWLDRDERSVCANPADPASFPGSAGCPDINGDLSLDIDDFITFQTLFAIGDPRADFNSDQVLDVDDFIAYQTAFGLCPG